MLTCQSGISAVTPFKPYTYNSLFISCVCIYEQRFSLIVFRCSQEQKQSPCSCRGIPYGHVFGRKTGFFGGISGALWKDHWLGVFTPVFGLKTPYGGYQVTSCQVTSEWPKCGLKTLSGWLLSDQLLSHQ
jgi:hypothetical protein